jgi:hypothetical protein
MKPERPESQQADLSVRLIDTLGGGYGMTSQ